MKKINYKPRIVDKTLNEVLNTVGAVLITGAKWCGKTTTALQVANSILYLNNPDNMSNYLNLAKIKPSMLLEGETPRLIDEWQLAPNLWDAVRFFVDQRGENRQFILTGSSTPNDSTKIYHSGVGRFAILKMRPMSLYESGESTGEISLKNLFNSNFDINAKSNLGLEDIAFLICRGGWPASIDKPKEIALIQAKNYYDVIVTSDINRADGINKNEERVKLLMRSLARNQGQSISASEIANDMRKNDNSNLGENTIFLYLNALKKIFAIEDLPSWNPNLRSRVAIRTSDCKYYVDPSIAAMSLGLGPNDLINDLSTFGFLFETLVMRDLRVYADSIDGQVYHFRNKNNLECDAVIHLRNGKYGLIEIKLGGEESIEKACESLNKVESLIDFKRMKKPSFKMVLIGVGKFAYRRDDGILVVPIGTLKN